MSPVCGKWYRNKKLKRKKHGYDDDDDEIAISGCAEKLET